MPEVDRECRTAEQRPTDVNDRASKQRPHLSQARRQAVGPIVNVRHCAGVSLRPQRQWRPQSALCRSRASPDSVPRSLGACSAAPTPAQPDRHSPTACRPHGKRPAGAPRRCHVTQTRTSARTPQAHQPGMCRRLGRDAAVRKPWPARSARSIQGATARPQRARTPTRRASSSNARTPGPPSRSILAARLAPANLSLPRPARRRSRGDGSVVLRTLCAMSPASLPSDHRRRSHLPALQQRHLAQSESKRRWTVRDAAGTSAELRARHGQVACNGTGAAATLTPVLTVVPTPVAVTLTPVLTVMPVVPAATPVLTLAVCRTVSS